MFFSALIYLKEKKSYPLQLILREIVVSGIMTDGSDFFGTPMTEMVVGEAIKAATIIVVVLPILCIYPFIQKYFVKGMMIGSLKG